MTWIFSTCIGLVTALWIYFSAGAVTNLLIGPMLGYRIMSCSFLGIVIADEEGHKKLSKGKFSFVPEVMLYNKENEKSFNRLILEIFPVVLGFSAGIVLSVLYGGIRGFGRYVLICLLSGLAVICCWHIFIVLKMAVYMYEKEK